ncbi:cytochrome c [Sandarakinorhabdus limnophila]|uniref:cytochrome c n=1 Tax=Sandarakinorhabdus limnophila TaxID=210512 RepID=UPI0023530267|nr:cytochrome c [Sandarakinorhabdus limnophila]
MRVLLALAALALVAAAPPTKRLSVELPDVEGFLPERYGVSSEAVNNNCLACHSAAMITAQPRLSRVQWGETIAKMRTVYAAPIDPADDKAILDWLVAD